ncbi:MAG TPA: glycosyltransferase family A protein [Solirubrobacteraceae bacterium]|jgi:glycosyltransferase involved in cell wall biosynthesis|nr:glycosyltransferase family A protein [Solirubrobacteraceae bacterium]
MKIACVVSFLDEDRFLPSLLDSIAAQTRPPDELLLVDDGSRDRSQHVAARFASGRPAVRLLCRERRPRERDRLVNAPELRAFRWAVGRLSEPWDVVVKMDADLSLSPDLFATMEREFESDTRLGIGGAYLSVVDPHTQQLRRERCRSYHTRGGTKFYRRACWEQIGPLPEALGWDTIDELAARRAGWRTASVACDAGDTIHLRPTGVYDGRVRAQYRWGSCAYGIGQHPLWVLASAVRRIGEPPFFVAAVAFLSGWVAARLRGGPRASQELREFGRSEQLAELRSLVRGSAA